jgi:hypothetical protein
LGSAPLEADFAGGTTIPYAMRLVPVSTETMPLEAQCTGRQASPADRSIGALIPQSTANQAVTVIAAMNTKMLASILHPIPWGDKAIPAYSFEEDTAPHLPMGPWTIR